MTDTAPRPHSAPPRLLAITAGRDRLDLAALDELIEGLAEDGVDAVQIRDKARTDRELLQLAERAVGRADGRLAVLVNARADVARAAGADGVHLPSRGVPTQAVRAHFPELLVGRSTHRADEVAEAARDGAHYVTFGPVCATPSKARYGEPQGWEALRRVCADHDLPVLALGGLDADHAASVQDAGAWGLAGIRAFEDAASRRRLVEAWRVATRRREERRREERRREEEAS